MKSQIERTTTNRDKLRTQRVYLRFLTLFFLLLTAVFFSSEVDGKKHETSLNPGLSTTDIKKLDYKGDLLLQDQKYEEAIGVWKQVLDRNPQHVDTLLRTGIALSLMEEYQQAEATLSHALEVQPNNPKVLYNLGLLFLRQKQYDKALEYLERTLQVVDWYPEANYHIGLIYEEKGLKEKALDYYIKEVNSIAASAKTWQRLFMLKKELTQQSEPSTGKNGFPTKAAILVAAIFLAIASMLFLRKLLRVNNRKRITREQIDDGNSGRRFK